MDGPSRVDWTIFFLFGFGLLLCCSEYDDETLLGFDGGFSLMMMASLPLLDSIVVLLSARVTLLARDFPPEKIIEIMMTGHVL